MPDHELPRHSLSRAAFHEFCSGAASRDTMVALADAEYSRRRLLLRAVVDAVPANGELADPEPAWDVLVAVEARAPDVVRELILYPPFGVWLRRAVIRLRGADHSSGSPLEYLNTVAAAAAIRADLQCVLTLTVWHGVIVLPTVGRLRLPTRFPAGTAELRHSATGTRILALGGRLSIRVDTTRADEHFRPAPAHVVTAKGAEFAVWIDDTDPYREFAEPLPPTETGPTELLEWRKLLDEAWDILARRHPGWAVELAAGLRTVTPVAHGDGDSGFSSAAAIGAIAVPTGLSATTMAEVFVHEFQHSKLNALSRLVNLTTPDARDRYYAPWREDPRPLAGMLHGIYAFVAVAEFWLVRGDEAGATTGEFLLAHRRQQVAWALDSLAGEIDGITDHGAELVAAV
ncbi:MAG TPA: HEXXH motif domain-containing protein, partial [Pseudonocardiaceae bacterium]